MDKFTKLLINFDKASPELLEAFNRFKETYQSLELAFKQKQKWNEAYQKRSEINDRSYSAFIRELNKWEKALDEEPPVDETTGERSR